MRSSLLLISLFCFIFGMLSFSWWGTALLGIFLLIVCIFFFIIGIIIPKKKPHVVEVHHIYHKE